MGRNRLFTKDEFMRALEGCNGVKYRLAKRLRVSRSTVGRYLDRYPDAKEKFLQMREEYLDELELEAAKIALEDRNLTMIIFLLKTLGKKRGYAQPRNVKAKCSDNKEKCSDNSGYLVLTRQEEKEMIEKGLIDRPE